MVELSQSYISRSRWSALELEVEFTITEPNRMAPLLLPSFIALALPYVVAQHNAQGACVELKSALSEASGVFQPGSLDYNAGIKHWATSSAQVAACVVEPGSAEDVAEIVSFLVLPFTRVKAYQISAKSRWPLWYPICSQGRRSQHQPRLLLHNRRADCDEPIPSN
jgi:hypothetical protein